MAAGYCDLSQRYSGLNIGPPETPCLTKVEIRVQCHHLQNRDLMSKSDPMVVLFMQEGEKWVQKGRTENVKNSLDPEFSKTFDLDYFFEEVQNLRFEVFDIDNSTPELSDDDFLGVINCTLGQVVASSPFTKALLSRSGNRLGKSTITVTAEEVDTFSKDVLVLSFRAENLDKKDFLGKSDPFLEIKRQLPDGSWLLVHRTEVIKHTLNPVWKKFDIAAKSFGGNNPEIPMLLVCYDHDDDGGHDMIGECRTTLGQIMQAQNQQVSWPCINMKKKQKKGNSYTNSGTIILSSCQVTKDYSFLDYIFGGTQINFTVAVDFTASNGDPRDPNSLHHIDPIHHNEYMKAIWAVGNVIQDYDSDKMFPALGFGAKIPPNWQVSHEFPLNFNINNPFCSGVHGLVEAYRNCLPQVKLYGPTNIAPIINHTACLTQQTMQQQAQQTMQQQVPNSYFILLILTDGVITDMDETRQAIVAASHLPMSIIIIGVGRADFSAMNFLDGDDGALRAPDGRPVLRDIVQFVPFYKYEQGPPSLLAKEVLAEVPSQVVQFYKMLDIPPNPPRQKTQMLN
ncbi:copine-3-like [Limulus polyphemus]|uniref:Copine-3-like n=1 Tax=Limulus polyphemus TaxID=6850 RepID=A0ABM1BIW2_LIMPO|nr:copine-3-like [Limulus polyphemus]XP_022250935.1 copine-3-like [Limulus polyphemus]